MERATGQHARRSQFVNGKVKEHQMVDYDGIEIGELRERNEKLIAALREIARKRKLDGVAAASMQAIANDALAYLVDNS